MLLPFFRGSFTTYTTGTQRDNSVLQRGWKPIGQNLNDVVPSVCHSLALIHVASTIQPISWRLQYREGGWVIEKVLDY